MAIFGFLNKKEEKDVSSPSMPTAGDKDETISEESPSQYGPKGVLRGPGGKFVSKKKPTEVAPEKKEGSSSHKKPSSSEPKGPIVTTYYGNEVRRYYWGKKWYFSVEDVLKIGTAVPALPPYKELVNQKETREILSNNIEIISEAPFATVENLTEIIRSLKLSFPGPIVDWLVDTSKFSYQEPKN